MEQEKPERLVDKATEEQLRDIVCEWMRANGEFRAFVEHSLNPSVCESSMNTFYYGDR